MTKRIANVRVGKPDVKPDKPSHVKGVRMGNKPGSTEAQPGIIDEGLTARATPERSTAISPESKGPIDPDMPTLTPP